MLNTQQKTFAGTNFSRDFLFKSKDMRTPVGGTCIYTLQETEKRDWNIWKGGQEST